MRTHSANNDRNRSSRSSRLACAECSLSRKLLRCGRFHAVRCFVAQCLLGLGYSRVSLATKFAGSGGPTVIEEARKERLEEGAEDDLGTTERSC